MDDNSAKPQWRRLFTPRASLEEYSAAQLQTLQMFRQLVETGRLLNLHSAHFDWWVFPVENTGSRTEFLLRCEGDIAQLLATPHWTERYRESVRLVAHAWGWDVERGVRLSNGGKWWRLGNMDIRLAKVIRSLWLFRQSDYLYSMRDFARQVHETEKGGEGFEWNGKCLDEILFLSLPRAAS